MTWNTITTGVLLLSKNLRSFCTNRNHVKRNMDQSVSDMYTQKVTRYLQKYDSQKSDITKKSCKFLAVQVL